MTSQPGLHTIPIHIVFNISQSKCNQTMKYGQLIEHNKTNILNILYVENKTVTSSRLLLFLEKA